MVGEPFAKFKPICDPQELIIGEGTIALITGWTSPEIAIKRVESKLYAVAGPLRSCHQGIDLVVRNLLANESTKGVVLLSASPYNNAPNGNALVAFKNLIEKGVSSEKYNNNRLCIRGGVGSIDQELAYYVYILQRLKILEVTSLKEVARSLQILSNINLPGRSPIFIHPPKTEISNSEPLVGNVIKAKTVSEAWLKILNLIRVHGYTRSLSENRGYWQEVIDLTTVIREDETYYPDYLPCDESAIAQYLPQLTDENPPHGISYSYGSRLRSWFGVNQIEQVVNKLKNDPNSTSGVCSLWDVNDHNKGGSPCLNHLWFRIMGNKLLLTALFRSNDMFEAWPLNAYGLREIQREVAERLGYDMGELITISQSAHIYSWSEEFADEVLDKHYREKDLISYDPLGNFTIHSEGKMIKIELRDRVTNEVIKSRSAHKRSVIKELPKLFPGMSVEHAVYLGSAVQSTVQSI